MRSPRKYVPLLLIFGEIVSAEICQESSSPLICARSLASHIPQPLTTIDGEYENSEWWDTNEQLFNEARKQYGPKNLLLYQFNEEFEKTYIEPSLYAIINSLYSDMEMIKQFPTFSSSILKEKEKIILDQHLYLTTVDDVYKLKIFNEKFCIDMINELKHWEISGIPMRRPNGMNRYGAILSEINMDMIWKQIINKYIRPLSQMIFHKDAIDDDFTDHYGFIVNYKLNEDLSLATHADASTITLNLCLSPKSSFQGGGLTFGDIRFQSNHKVKDQSNNITENIIKSENNHNNNNNNNNNNKNELHSNIVHQNNDCGSGSVLLHRGQHLHSANQLIQGERANLIVWCYNDNGVVRVSPYEVNEQSTLLTRWKAISENKDDKKNHDVQDENKNELHEFEMFHDSNYKKKKAIFVDDSHENEEEVVSVLLAC